MRISCSPKLRYYEEIISIIDSTPISLKGRGFEWVLENKTNRTTGLKIHLELRSDTNSPTSVNITPPNINNITNVKKPHQNTKRLHIRHRKRLCGL